MDFRKIRASNWGPLTLDGTNTYLIGSALIDPGPDDDRHLKDILACGPVERIVLTHSHPDHSAGAQSLSELTGAPVLSFGAGLEDGDRLAELVAVHTPGHSPDHLCFWHPESRTLLSGDLIAGKGSIMVAPPDGDMGDYMASLERVRDLSPAHILPGHGPEVPDGAAKIEEYLAHRRGREERISNALRSGATSMEEIMELAYADVPPEMRPYARRSAMAHLDKLGHRIPT